MVSSSTSLPDVRRVADEIGALLREPVRVQVTGPEGSGRSMLASALERSVDGVRRIDLPDLTEPDAAAAILLAATSLLGGDPQRYITSAGAPTPCLQQEIRAWDGVVVIRAQGVTPWRDATDRSGEHKRRITLAIDILAQLRSAVWIVDGRPLALGPESRRFTLPDHRAPLSAVGWEGLTVAAERLLAEVSAVVASPVVWRLAVGAVHLGADPTEVAARVRKPTAEALPDLARWIAVAFKEDPVQLSRARLLLLARRPILRATWADAFGDSASDRDLFTRGLGYGDPVRLNPFVRTVCAEALGVPEAAQLAQAHAGLAAANELEDGALDPAALRGSALSAWVEKLHHLGLGGDATRDAWQAQHKVWPEHYWERARHLSIARKDYRAAAEIYEACLRRFPQDAYAHHYYAWNLEQAKVNPSAQRTHYARAVELDPEHPWWRARQICQLIQTQSWSEALVAWRSALERIAPDGMITAQLAAHLHFWVAEAWMTAGVWFEAWAVLKGVPAAARSSDTRRWDDLDRQIDEARRAERAALDAWFAEQGGDRVLSERVAPAWRTIASAIAEIPVPAVTEGEDGPVLAWSHPGIYLSIEFLPDGKLDWYARDLVRDEVASGQTDRATDVPLLRWLRRVWHG